MIAPLIIANKIFSNNIIQGPLAGVSCAPFRQLTWQYSQPAFSCTEMISCKTLLHQQKSAQHRFVYKDPQEGPVCFQLASNNPVELAAATKIVTDYGADIIDLNCGCPVNKIRQKGAGSRLLTDSSKLYQLMIAMKKNTHLPVSIKIRVEGQGNETFHDELINIIKDAGIDFLVVHGRHWTESYEVACHYEQIQYFVDRLSIPVIGNGDIVDGSSLQQMMATGCAGAMISRAGVGQPWLIAKLIAEMQQKAFITPTSAEIGNIFITHVEKLAILLNSEKFAILQARKLAKYYARTMTNKAEFCQAINVCEDISNFKHLCIYYFS